MYPLLKSLHREGLVKAESGRGRGAAKNYSLTTKGRRELEQIRGMMAGAGRKDQVMGRLFSELLPGEVFVPMILRRYRESADTLRQKFSEVPAAERETLLHEFRFLLESQIAWADSQLGPPVAQVHSRAKQASKL
jgi:DNA-binding PadR family transcriptional regulator